MVVHGRTLRLVSLSERGIGLQLIQLEIEGGEVEINLEASFEGLHLELVPERLDQDIGLWRTHGSGKRLAMATSSSLRIDGHDLPPTALGELKYSWKWTCRPAQIVQFARIVAVARSDANDENPDEEARTRLGGVHQIG